MTYLHTHSVIYPSFKLHFLLYPPISFPTWPFLALFRFPLHILWRAIAIALDCQSGLQANKKLTVDPTTESKWLWSAQPQIEQLCYTTSPRPKDHHGEGGITIVIGLKRLEQKYAMSAAFITHEQLWLPEQDVHKTNPVSILHGVGRESRVSTTNWGTMNSWRLLWGGESIFLKSMIPGKSTIFQSMALYLEVYRNHKLNLMSYLRNDTKLREEWIWGD